MSAKNGIVKFFNESKGYGFITESETKKDVFFHFSGCEDQVDEGDEVTYDEKDGKKGINAINIKLV